MTYTVEVKKQRGWACVCRTNERADAYQVADDWKKDGYPVRMYVFVDTNMKAWKISKHAGGYREIIVHAATFDDALTAARRIDPEFNSGQIIEEYWA